MTQFLSLLLKQDKRKKLNMKSVLGKCFRICLFIPVLAFNYRHHWLIFMARIAFLPPQAYLTENIMEQHLLQFWVHYSVNSTAEPKTCPVVFQLGVACFSYLKKCKTTAKQFLGSICLERSFKIHSILYFAVLFFTLAKYDSICQLKQ